MSQSKIERVNKESVRVACVCGESYTESYKNYLSEYMEEFQAYPNFGAMCPECGAFYIMNINMPITEYHEFHLLPYMDEEEAKQRELVRQVAWTIRPDLVELDREQIEKQKIAELEAEHGMDIEELRNQFKEDAYLSIDAE